MFSKIEDNMLKKLQESISKWHDSVLDVQFLRIANGYSLLLL